MAETANATMRSFGYPDTLVREYVHWCVLLRPAQVTLGSLVLVCKDEARQFSAIPPAAFAELATVTGDIETSLKAFRPWDKINYLMLMMVDPDVHFHVLPRYPGSRAHGGLTVPDAGWPAQPRLDVFAEPTPDQAAALCAHLRAHWPPGPAAAAG